MRACPTVRRGARAALETVAILACDALGRLAPTLQCLAITMSTNDKIKNKIETVADKAKIGVDRAVLDVKEAAHHAADKVKEAGGAVGEKVKDAGEAMKDAARSAKQKLDHAGNKIG